MKFKETEREDLSEMFGKSLAGAPDWNKRKIRPSDYTTIEECSLIFTETEHANNCFNS